MIKKSQLEIKNLQIQKNRQRIRLLQGGQNANQDAKELNKDLREKDISIHFRDQQNSNIKDNNLSVDQTVMGQQIETQNLIDDSMLKQLDENQLSFKEGDESQLIQKSQD